LNQSCIGRAVNIDWIRFHAQLTAIDDQCFHFIEQYKRRASLSMFGDCLTEELSDGPLRFAQ
jgi:hypothetical protein